MVFFSNISSLQYVSAATVLSFLMICVGINIQAVELKDSISHFEIKEEGLVDIDWSIDCGSLGKVTSLQLSSCYSETNCTLIADYLDIFYNLTVEFIPQTGHAWLSYNTFARRNSESESKSETHTLLRFDDPKPVLGGVPTRRSFAFFIPNAIKGTKEWNITTSFTGDSNNEVCLTFLVTIVGAPEEETTTTTTTKSVTSSDRDTTVTLPVGTTGNKEGSSTSKIDTTTSPASKITAFAILCVLSLCLTIV